MDPLIIPVVALLLPVVLVPTIMSIKHRHTVREWEHLERMRALATGVSRVGNSEYPRSIAAIGTVVPAAAVCMAFLTSTEGPSEVDGVPVSAIAWGCAAVISLAAFATSLLLALIHGRPDRSASQLQTAKPVFEPDAFDVASHRG
jgi:hypothetical protein